MAKYEKKEIPFAGSGIPEVLGVAKVTEDGEKRAALRLPNGDSTTITIRGERGGWQDAHIHRATTEIYVVHSGWMALAIADDPNTASFRVERYHAGGMVRVSPGKPHNVFLPAGAVISTVKLVPASGAEGDWEAHRALDRWCEHVTERMLERFQSS